MVDSRKHKQNMMECLTTAELKIMMTVYAAKTEEEITAVYAALSASLGQSVRLRCEEIEASVDRVRQNADQFFLMQGGAVE